MHAHLRLYKRTGRNNEQSFILWYEELNNQPTLIECVDVAELARAARTILWRQGSADVLTIETKPKASVECVGTSSIFRCTKLGIIDENIFWRIFSKTNEEVDAEIEKFDQKLREE